MGGTRGTTSVETCVLPVFKRIHDVPSVLFVVVNAAAEDDTCAARRQGEQVTRTDLGSAECSAGFGEAHAPTTIAPRPHSGDAARDGYFHVPSGHALPIPYFTVELRV